jgi:ABC-2 type transport system ATP-binding protein
MPTAVMEPPSRTLLDVAAAPVALAIEAQDLCKSYGHVQALRSLTFQVPAGQIFGFLGHNGAGKTTAIKILTTVLHADSGSARVLGWDVRRDAERIAQQIGVVYEEQNLYERISARDNLALMASLYDVPDARRRIGTVLALVGLESRANDPVGKYSNGMKQRLLIARAILHQPAVLFLDEPTRGLDPSAALQIRALIHDLKQHGITVLLTSHQMEEVDHLCDRVAFLSEGRLVADDTPRNLKLRYGRRAVGVLLDGADEEVDLSLDDPLAVARLNAWLTERRVRSMHTREATLEEVFLQVAGRPLDGPSGAQEGAHI